MTKTDNTKSVEKMIDDKKILLPKEEKEIVDLLILRTNLIGECIVEDIDTMLDAKLVVMQEANKKQFDQVLLEVRAVTAEQLKATQAMFNLRTDLGYENGK